MSKNPVVRLETWEYEWASFVGIRRAVANWDRKNAKAYKGNEHNLEPNRIANIASCICEMAVAKYLNRYWSGSAWDWNKVDHEKSKLFDDVGQGIEVRRVRNETGPALKPKDKGKILYGAKVLGKEWRSVEILGWVFADDHIKRLKGRDLIYIDASKLNSPLKKPDC